MSTYTSVRQWEASFEKRLDKVAVNARTAHRLMVLAYKDNYYRFLSGNISEKELRRAGHPFGRTRRGREFRVRGPVRGVSHRLPVRKKYPRYPINAQTGKLRASLRVDARVNTATRLVHQVGTHMPYSKYIMHPLGTDLMVGREVTTGHEIGRTAPGILERHFRASKRPLRKYFRVSTVS